MRNVRATSEGLENCWLRHKQNQLALIAGLEALGIELFVPNPEERLPTVTAVHIPAGLQDALVRRQLLEEFGIEIAGGVGLLKGKLWRIGLMGYVSQMKHVLLFLAALEKVLLDQGLNVGAGAGVGAAVRVYGQQEAVARRVDGTRFVFVFRALHASRRCTRVDDASDDSVFYQRNPLPRHAFAIERRS